MTTETERKEPPMLAGLYRIMEYAQDKKLCPLCGLEECDCWAPLATAIQAIQDMAPLRESHGELLTAVRNIRERALILTDGEFGLNRSQICVQLTRLAAQAEKGEAS